MTEILETLKQTIRDLYGFAYEWEIVTYNMPDRQVQCDLSLHQYV